MTAAVQSNVASRSAEEGQAKRGHRSVNRGRMATSKSRSGDRASSLRGDLDKAKGGSNSKSTRRSSVVAGPSLCPTDPQPWKYKCPDSGEQLCSEQLIAENLNLARKYAWNWSKKSSFDYQELEALAYVGLIKGVRKFDPRKGYKLSTICVPYINGEILHYFRDKGYAIKYPSKWREVIPKARKMLEAGTQPKEISEVLGMTLAELEEMLGSMCGTSELRDEVIGSTEDGLEVDLLRPLEALAEMSWKRLNWADQQFIQSWWETNKRRAPLPRLQLASFDRIGLHFLEGRPLEEVRESVITNGLKNGLVMDLFGNLSEPPKNKKSTSQKKQPSGRGKEELDAMVLQMGLFDPSGVAKVLNSDAMNPMAMAA